MKDIFELVLAAAARKAADADRGTLMWRKGGFEGRRLSQSSFITIGPDGARLIHDYPGVDLDEVA